MAYNKTLANRILQEANSLFPDPIANLQHLFEVLGIAAEDQSGKQDVLRSLDALDKEDKIKFQVPVRTGLDKVLNNFVNLELTSSGRRAAEMLGAPPEETSFFKKI